MDLHQEATRNDTGEKCQGITRYLHDIAHEGMIDAITVRSPVRRGRLVSVDSPALPGGYCRVDASDIPGPNQIVYFQDPCPILAQGEVNYIGQPVMLLAGSDPRMLRRLAGETRVLCKEAPAIRTLEESLAGQLPPIFGEDNVYYDEAFGYGDVDAAFAQAHDVFETVSRTGYQEHMYLEPQAALAVPGKRMTVYASTQGPHVCKRVLCAALDMPPEAVRVVQTPVGGGFGGKIEQPFFLAVHAALAAKKSGRPVRLVYSRSEDLLATTKRHPSRITIRSALDADGRILAVDSDVVFQAGGYAVASGRVLDTGLKKAMGVYHFPAARVRGRAMATNNVLTGAFRGFGAPQAFFAIEGHLGALARRLGIEPLDFKQRYFTAQGQATITGGRYHFPVSLPEVVKTVVTMSGYDRRRQAPPPPSGIRRGMGLALFNFGAPFSMDTSKPLPPSHVGLCKHPDGSVEVLSELVDMGQGLHTAYRKLAACALGLPIERIFHRAPDTDNVPFASITGASMSVVFFGPTLLSAAEKLLPRLDEPGEIRVLEQVTQPGHVTWDAEQQRGDPFNSYVWGAVAAEVEVDEATFQARVRKLWLAIDIGTPVDRRIVKGQMEGGLTQGVGFALLEAMPRDVAAASLSDYCTPTSLDAPPMEVSLVDNPYPPGPYGAKCVGEPPIVAVAPAIADAVAEACGVEIFELPISPEKIMQAMQTSRRTP